MAGHPIRLPVRASVQGTSWRGPHFRVDVTNRLMPRGSPSPLCGELRTSWLCNQTMRLGNDADAYTQHVSGDYTRVAVHVPKPTSGFVRGDADRIIGLARLGWPLCAIVDECGTALHQTED